MVTSALAGEGKSFTSLNLATSIARQRDREVVLVDVDAKQDSLGALLGLSNVPGILDLAAEPGGDAEEAPEQNRAGARQQPSHNPGSVCPPFHVRPVFRDYSA